MSETRRLFAETATRVFADTVTRAVLEEAERAGMARAVWQAAENAGLTRALAPEHLGGSGAAWADGYVIARAAGAAGAPAPVAETLMACGLLARAGLAAPEGPLALLDGEFVLRKGRLSGRAPRTAWARHATHGIAVAGETLALVPLAGAKIAHGDNLAREPRDDVALDDVPAETAPCPSAVPLRAAGAALRAGQIAGAVSRVLEMTADYARTRVQFGRPIASFQAIQHALARLAGEAAAAERAAERAFAAFDTGGDALECAAAKIRCAEAAGRAAAIAHQVHGAIGFTYEHQLHFLTKRLWSWRAEFGNAAEWSALLGRASAREGAEGLWPFVTARFV